MSFEKDFTSFSCFSVTKYTKLSYFPCLKNIYILLYVHLSRIRVLIESDVRLDGMEDNCYLGEHLGQTAVLTVRVLQTLTISHSTFRTNRKKIETVEC